MKTILIPVDFQPAAGKALHYIEKVFKDQLIKAELLYVLHAFRENDEGGCSKVLFRF